MFSNFKLPSFLSKITSPDDENRNSCSTSLNTDSQQYKHSMDKFYTDFAILGEQNKLKTVFAKKVTSTFLADSDTQSNDDSTQQNSKAEVVYLKKKHQSSMYIDTDKNTYDHIAFKMVFFEERYEKEFEERLMKQLKYNANVKKAAFCRNLQLPINYFVQQVNSVCSKHTCVCVVIKRWSMGLVDRLNLVLSQEAAQSSTTSGLQKKISLSSGMQSQNRPGSYNQSTTYASNHSSSMNNYDQSLVNQLNFDKARSPNALGQRGGETNLSKNMIARQLLIVVKCAIRSLEFLKEENALPHEFNLASVLWQERLQESNVEGYVEKQVPVLSQHKKILTTLTRRHQFGQSLGHQSYLVANPAIPNQSLGQLLKQVPSKTPLQIVCRADAIKQITNRLIPQLNATLLSTYPSPEELTQSIWQPQSMLSSLLFKLGMTVLELWIIYGGIIGQFNQSLSNQKISNINNRIQDIYSHENGQSQVVKINWLYIAELVNGIDKNSIASKQTDSKQGNRMLGLLKKTVKLLLSRSAIERKSVSNLVASTEFIEITTGKTLTYQHTLSKASSTYTQPLQSTKYPQPISMAKKYSSQTQYTQRWPPVFSQTQAKPLNVKEPKIMPIVHNINSYSSRLQNPNINTNFDPKQAYLKVINENQGKIKSFHRNQTISHSYQIYPSQSNGNYQSSIYQPIPSVTPSKFGRQAIVTPPISFVSQPSSYTYYQPYTPLLTNNFESHQNSQPSSQYCTPTFVDGSNHKAFLKQDMTQQSPKRPVNLFDCSTDSSNQINYEYKRISARQNSLKKSESDSPVNELQLKVQISSSDQELPSYLPESSKEKIDYMKIEMNRPSSHRLNEKILIQQDLKTSEKKISIAQQLFASIKPNSEGNQPLQISNSTDLLQTENSHQNQNFANDLIRPVSSQNLSSTNPQQPLYIIEQYKGGGRYQGYTKNKKRNGYGKLYYYEGSHYEGDWLEDQMNGYGKLYYSNGKLAYEGQWVMDEFFGTGKVYNDSPTMLDDSYDYTNFNNLEEQWVYYEGQLEHDLKQGHGVIMLENGEWFEGGFHEDKINGKGKFVNLEGEVIYGRWKDNIMVEEYAD